MWTYVGENDLLQCIHEYISTINSFFLINLSIKWTFSFIIYNKSTIICTIFAYMASQ